MCCVAAIFNHVHRREQLATGGSSRGMGSAWVDVVGRTIELGALKFAKFT